MNLGIQNKRALVTGASRGIGEAIVRMLATEGVRLAIVSRTPSEIRELLQDIGGTKAGHVGYPCDLTREKAAHEIILKLQKDFGMPDVLVNNLGGDLLIKDPFCSIADWQKLWRLNMEVAIEFTNLCVPFMKKKKWGRIVNISSIASLENQGTVPYCSIKAALTAYSRSIGRVVAPDGIIVSVVCPGAVMTQGGYWARMQKSNPHHVKKYLSERMAIQRFGIPEEIASFVAFLCSKHASFAVGTMVPIDGGQGRVFF